MRWAQLFAAVVLLGTANGRWVFAASAWLGPVFLLHYVRNSAAWTGWIAGYLVVIATAAVGFYKVIPLPPGPYAGVIVGFGLALYLPYVLDRLLYRRLPKLVATLPFPAALVSIEYVIATFSPFGSWGSLVYTQFGHLPLLQVTSITGPYGVTFLVAWCAPVASYCWTHRNDWGAYRQVALTYAGALALVLVFGYVRLATAPSPPTVRVAAVSAPLGEGRELFRAMHGFDNRAEFEAARAAAAGVNDELLAMARREARAGARIVLWAECNALVIKSDEAALIEEGKALAREEGFHLLMALATIGPRSGGYENVVYTVDSNGEIVNCYHKARPVPGDSEVLSDAEIAVVDTPHGRMAIAICFDMDFPEVIRKAGRAGADFLIAPSKDWPEIDPLHTHMAMVRGIENGCSVVRGVYDGLSMSADPMGRILGAEDVRASEYGTMVVQIPTAGVRTVYGRVGDIFAWLCCAAVCGLAVLLPFRRAHAVK